MKHKISLPEVLTWSLKLYSDHFIDFLWISFLGSIPSLIYQITTSVRPEAGHNEMIVLSIISLTVGSVFFIILIRAVGNAENGNSVPLPQLLGEGLRRLGAFFGAFLFIALAQIILAFLISLGSSASTQQLPVLLLLGLLVFLLLCLAAIIYVSVVFLFFPFDQVLENSGVIGSLKTSWAVYHSAFWRVSGGLLLITAVFLAVILPVFIGLKIFGVHPAFIAAATGVASVLLWPLMVAYLYRVYKLFRNYGSSISITIYDKNATKN